MRYLGKTICVCWEKEMRLGGARRSKVWGTLWSLHRADEKRAVEGEEPGGDAAMWQKREMGCIKMEWCFAKLDGAAAVLMLWGRGPTSKPFPETSARRQNGFQAVVWRSSFQVDLLSVCSLKAQRHGAKVVFFFFFFFFLLQIQYLEPKIFYTQCNKVQKTLPAIFCLISRWT